MLSDRRRRVPRQEGFVSSETLMFSDEDGNDNVVSARPGRRGRPSLRLTLKNRELSGGERSASSSSSTNNSSVNRTRRSTRASNVRYAFGSDDEEGSSDDLLGSASVTIPGRRRFGRKIVLRNSRRLRARRSDSDSESSAPKGVRFSTRNRNARRTNLRERWESDISENEAVTTEKKFSGAKEVFSKVPTDDPFRHRHRNVCDTCFVLGDEKAKGPLVFCQGCTGAFHTACLGPRGAREHLVTKVGYDKFVLQCRRCIGTAHKKDSTAPHLGHCTECQSASPLAKPLRERLSPRHEQQLREKNGGVDPITTVDKSLVDNVDNVLFRCINCTRAYHFEHLPPKSEDSHVGQAEDLSPAEIANMRFKEYGRRWMCHDCITAPGDIEGLVAWRPVDVDSYTPGFIADVLDEVEKEYLIKWKRKSYYRTTWMPGAWVWGVASPHMRKAFLRSPKGLKPQMTAEDAIPEEYFRVDVVLDVRYTNIVSNRTKEIDLARVKEVKEAYVKFKGLLYEDTVWETMPNPDDTERWNDFKAAYEDWVLRDYVRVPKAGSLKKHLDLVRSQNFKTTLVKKSQPKCMTGGKIMEYQLEGLNWLYYMWYKQKNAILADEMGLGKTIQIIAFLATLIEDHRCWPFLVVVPNATCPNWRREIKKWVPSVRVVTYYGSTVARKIAHDYEMFPNDATDLRCHIVITSYETMIDGKAKRVLSSIPWAGLVVDEGQRLKNDKNLLYESLSGIYFPFKVLLTGTPLQNNTRELFNLLQFCDPTLNAQDLQEKYETLTKENVPELHDLIRPFFLRRTKAQVLTFLPPMAQIILPVSMSIVQKKLYKSILAKNSQLIKSIFQNNHDQNVKQTERHSLSNILMQLRKCLCHPFVYSKAIEERSFNAAVSQRNLVEASGKLQLLELMLPKLKERGHRVLLFSQFLDNLDIVEDFLDGLGLLHRRLDGSMSSHEKQKRIDEFNAPNSPYFAFLLSTRSGGVGINLATADTVIIMDPDFNPHQDIQALSRAHRIGQEKKVLVFQLMTRASAEEKIMQIGKKKMALDHVLIEKMDADDEAGIDLESILRHGAEALFENDETGDIHYDFDSVDKLLDRSQAENTQVGNDASAESQFSFARVWANDTGALEDRLGDSDTATPTNNTVWEKILQERERAAAEEAAAQAQSLGRGKRKRNVVDYAVNEGGPDHSPAKPSKKPSQEPESDVEFNARSEASDDAHSEEDEPGSGEITPMKKTSAQKGKEDLVFLLSLSYPPSHCAPATNYLL
jgi:chromodomain-helicase-DNA-binding protein 4